MILSDLNILNEIKANHTLIKSRIDIDTQLQPASVDLTLGKKFKVLDEDNYMIEHDKKAEYKDIQMQDGKLIVAPHSFVLATTNEYIELPENISAFIEGRSSIGRKGLNVENAGWVDSGFEGKITLELFNSTNFPWVLKENMRICQIVFAYNKNPVLNLYNGKYQKQNTVMESKSEQDREFNQGIYTNNLQEELI